MEREILFRGKRVDNGVWVYGDPHHLYDGKIGVISNLTDKKQLVPTLYTIIPETVGMSAGLTDEAGEEIFEGDIVRYTYRSKGGENKEYLCVVAYEAGAFGIAYGTYHHGNLWLTFDVDFGEKCDNFISFFELMWNSENPDCMTENYVDCVKVIGNIHDNPELLRGADDA